MEVSKNGNRRTKTRNYKNIVQAPARNNEQSCVFRQLSSRLFTSEEDRLRLLDATQEHLDGLISLEDEAEEEEDEEDEA